MDARSVEKEGKMVNQIINDKDVVQSPRGRKSQLDPELAQLFMVIKEGQAVRLAGKFGPVPKWQRSTISQKIRRTWRAVRNDNCRIDYDPEGVPQVRIR